MTIMAQAMNMFELFLVEQGYINSIDEVDQEVYLHIYYIWKQLDDKVQALLPKKTNKKSSPKVKFSKKEFDDMSVALVRSDKNNLVLEKRIKELEHQIIKKDKYFHTLKESIKTDFLNLGENMMPKSYMRISKRFPHLTLKEIIDFEKKVRENGGSIQVHSGEFVLTYRDNHNNGHPQHGESCKDKYISWTCCHNWCYTGSGCNKPVRHYIKRPTTGDHRGDPRSPHEYTYEKYNRGHNLKHHVTTKGAIDLVNPQPDGQCDFPKTFYLKEEDEKKQDIGQVKVSDITTSISHNIKILEKTIEEYSEKMENLKSLQENLNLLKDI